MRLILEPPGDFKQIFKRFIHNISYFYLSKVENIFGMLRIIGALVFVLFYTAPVSGMKTESMRTHTADSIHVELEEVVVYPRQKQRAQYRRQKKQTRLEYNVRKAYPYARVAAEKITEIEARISEMESRAEEKKWIKKEYNELVKTFKKPLMQLTVSQGKILIRLIYRETQNTTFAHIKAYKGGANAYFWQTLALLFGNNLKADYDPNGEDQAIEQIVRTIEQENGQQTVAPVKLEDFQ